MLLALRDIFLLFWSKVYCICIFNGFGKYWTQVKERNHTFLNILCTFVKWICPSLFWSPSVLLDWLFSLCYFRLALRLSSRSDKSTICGIENKKAGVQWIKKVFFFLHCNKRHFTTLVKTPWNLAMFNHAVRVLYRLVADELKHLQALFMSDRLSSLHVFSWLLATASHFTNNTLIHHSSIL